MTTLIPEGHVDLVANMHTQGKVRTVHPLDTWNAARRAHTVNDQAKAQDRAALRAQAVQ